MSNTIRQVATVDRGLLDKTPVMAFPWELKILEELHGNVEVHTIDELCSTKGATVIAKLKLRYADKHAPDMREQLEAMLNTIPDEIDPLNSPQGEYERMAAIYGMHPEIQISMVEKVFGRFDEGRFTKLVEESFAGKTILIRGEEADVVESEHYDLDSAKAELKRLGVNVKGNPSLETLTTRIAYINKLNEEMIDFDVNDSMENLKILVEALS